MHSKIPPNIWLIMIISYLLPFISGIPALHHYLFIDFIWIIYVVPSFLSSYYGGVRKGIVVWGGLTGTYALWESAEIIWSRHPVWHFYHIVELAIVTFLVAFGTGILADKNFSQNQELQKVKQDQFNFMSVYEQMPDAIFFIGTDGKIMSVNKAAEELYGVTRSEVIGKSFLQFIDPEDQEKTLHIFSDCLKGIPFNGEIASRSVHGQLLYLDTTAISYFVDHKIAGIIGINRDITDRKRIEHSLKESRFKFEQAFHNAANMMFLMEETSDGSIHCIEANKAAQQKLGYTNDEFRLKSVNDIVLKGPVYTSGKPNFSARVEYKTKTGHVIHAERNQRTFEWKGKKLILIEAREVTETSRPLFRDKSDPGVNLRLIMAERGIGVSELAEQTGLSRATISNLRNGKIAKPHSFTARAVADALNVDATEIWNETEN
ncbi:PAS domain S-box protein [Cohnella pontilimi]|nr:PAS domain S-box protein [Cohnella pontilimi]